MSSSSTPPGSGGSAQSSSPSPEAGVDPASLLVETTSLLGVAQTTALLVESLHSHAAVDLAVGVLMSRYTMTPDAARTLIAQLARQDGVTVAAAARSLLPEEADDTPGATFARPVPQAPPLGPDAPTRPPRVDLALMTGLRHLDVDPRRAAALLEDLARVVPSVLGMSISLEPYDPGVTALEVHLVPRALEPAEIASALRLTGQHLTPGTATVVTLYAGLTGAFAGAAAALVATGQVRPADLDQEPPLPTEPVRPGIYGLEACATVQQALGVLVGRGSSLTQARAELSHRAQPSALPALLEAAQQLLDSAQHPRPVLGPAEH